MKTKAIDKQGTDTDRLLLILHRLLLGPCTPNELLEQLRQEGINILPDTLYRDINKLRRHGYQIPKATKRTNRQYVIEKVPFCLPFTVKEIRALKRAVSVAVQQRDPAVPALKQAMARLGHYLPEELANRLIKETAWPVVQANDALDMLRVRLEELCHRGQQIQIFYTPLRGKARILTVEPVEFVWWEGHWYVIAYDIEKAIWKELRLERIGADIKTLPRKRSMHQLPQHKAVFRLFPPLSTVYEARMGEQIEPDPDTSGAIKITTTYHSSLRFCQRLLRYEQFVEILSPLSLRQRMQQILALMTERYKGERE